MEILSKFFFSPNDVMKANIFFFKTDLYYLLFSTKPDSLLPVQMLNCYVNMHKVFFVKISGIRLQSKYIKRMCKLGSKYMFFFRLLCFFFSRYQIGLIEQLIIDLQQNKPEQKNNIEKKQAKKRMNNQMVLKLMNTI